MFQCNVQFFCDANNFELIIQKKIPIKINNLTQMKSNYISPMRSNSFEGSATLANSMLESFNTKTSLKDSFDNIRNPERSPTTQSPGLPNPYKEKYQKLSQTIKVVYLSIKRRLVKEDAGVIPALKDTVPVQEEDEMAVKKDPLVIASYIKKVYEKSLEVGAEEKKQLVDSNEKTMSQYEPMLQKLEAEVRKHIQIEQQMKILIENQQEKIIELERGEGRSASSVEKEMSALKKDYSKVMDESDRKIDNMEAENRKVREQLRNIQQEMTKLKAAFGNISMVMQEFGENKKN